MRRRLFSALTALALTSGVLLAGGAADAAVVTTTIGGVTYQADDAAQVVGATVVDVDNTAAKALTLPTSVRIQDKVYDVTTVADFAADGLALTSLTLPARLTSVGTGSFFGNTLTSVSLSPTLRSIGEGAFAGNQLSTVSLPAALRVIDSGAFASNKITSLAIPASVTVIDDAAFAQNPLTSVRFAGPPPTTFSPATTANGSVIGSFGDGAGLTVFYLPAFAAPAYSGGFTSPTWQGYRAVNTAPTTPPGTTPPATGTPFVYPAAPFITNVKVKGKGRGLYVFTITVVNQGGIAAQNVRVGIKNRPHRVTYPGGKTKTIGTMAPNATGTATIKVRTTSKARSNFSIKTLADNAPRSTWKESLPPR